MMVAIVRGELSWRLSLLGVAEQYSGKIQASVYGSAAGIAPHPRTNRLTAIKPNKAPLKRQGPTRLTAVFDANKAGD